MSRMPALFIGHGSPMNALERNGFTNGWRELGNQLPRPRALLVISAHWFIGATAVTAMPRPRTIHDFYGFPPELSAFEYPAPGAPDLAEEVVEVAKPRWIGLDQDQWGLDHGTWSVLAHLYPAADVPVIQLSINVLKPLDYHLDLAARLAPLRDRGVTILGSGNVVHNLARVQWDRPDSAFDWAERFDDAVAAQVEDHPAEILNVTGHADYRLAVPTPDHFIPMLYVAGQATDSEPVRRLIRGYAMGSISMACYGIGTDVQLSPKAAESAELPDDVPADQTNA
jgi:4,5-DOPA dioxygenase extradiol